MRSLIPSVPASRRPLVTAILAAAVILAAAANVAILEDYGRDHGKTAAQTAVWLARGLWKYGPVGVFRDPVAEPVSLQVKDGRRLR